MAVAFARRWVGHQTSPVVHHHLLECRDRGNAPPYPRPFLYSTSSCPRNQICENAPECDIFLYAWYFTPNQPWSGANIGRYQLHRAENPTTDCKLDHPAVYSRREQHMDQLSSFRLHCPGRHLGVLPQSKNCQCHDTFDHFGSVCQ